MPRRTLPRVPCALVLGALVLGAPSPAGARTEAEQMTPEGVANLQRLVDRARHGALGDDVDDVASNFTFKGLSSEGAVRLEIARAGHAPVNVLLLHPATFRPGARPRYFVLFPDDGIAPRHVARLAALLDETFATNPWNDAPDPTASNGLPPPPPPPSGPTSLHPVGRGRMFAGFGFLLGSTLLALVYFVSLRPRGDTERLV